MSDLASSGDVARAGRAGPRPGRLGIDTEFMGEGRYQTLLCLVQVAVETDDGVRIEVLDPLDERARPRAARGACSPTPRSRSSCTPAARTSRCCAACGQTDITNLFDTQLAAGFAGLRAQLGYEALLHELLGVRLKKSASFTRWDARPLSAEQIDYARDDVRHLLQATSALQERLRERGRLEWAREECVALARGHRRARPRHDLRAAAARELAGSEAARDRARARRAGARRRRGRRTGRSRRCCRMPRSSRSPSAGRAQIAQLEQIRGINEPTLRRRGRAILEAVERGRSRAADPRRGRASRAARRARRAGDRARRGARAHPRAGGASSPTS